MNQRAEVDSGLTRSVLLGHVARWVKEFRPGLPVIIATGFSEMIADEDYERARIDEVIRKPYALADAKL
jgi:hypothetical protein